MDEITEQRLSEAVYEALARFETLDTTYKAQLGPLLLLLANSVGPDAFTKIVLLTQDAYHTMNMYSIGTSGRDEAVFMMQSAAHGLNTDPEQVTIQ